MASLRPEYQRYVVEEFLKKYKIKSNGFLGPLLSFVGYAYEKISTDQQVMYNDKTYISLESKVYKKLCEVFDDCDKIIEALQFLEDQAYYLSKREPLRESGTI